jgi:hypothetical protein
MVGLCVAGVSNDQVAPTHAAGMLTQAFTLVSVNNSITPPTLIVQRNEISPLTTIRVAGTTSIVRRFGGKSDVTELSPGDHLAISGTNLGNHSVNATRIKDNSIQVAGTQINATVSWVARDFGRMAVHVTANEGANAAFSVGNTILVNISPDTPVIFLVGQGGGLPGVQGLRPGMPITLHGFSDHEGQVILNPRDIEEILGEQVNALIRIAPNDSSAR